MLPVCPSVGLLVTNSVGVILSVGMLVDKLVVSSVVGLFVGPSGETVEESVLETPAVEESFVEPSDEIVEGSLVESLVKPSDEMVEESVVDSSVETFVESSDEMEEDSLVKPFDEESFVEPSDEVEEISLVDVVSMSFP